ncbi:unnamed protein product [Ceratitis capitata]|uniref:(Mediterranean fruit fly) hypothetical protein n=1 Tax=Ceratitis capitata TaxID=7213 RepID=A0A811V603_CERCA|nr:unnamed protein product [Ceratitis capitata]
MPSLFAFLTFRRELLTPPLSLASTSASSPSAKKKFRVVNFGSLAYFFTTHYLIFSGRGGLRTAATNLRSINISSVAFERPSASSLAPADFGYRKVLRMRAMAAWGSKQNCNNKKVIRPNRVKNKNTRGALQAKVERRAGCETAEFVDHKSNVMHATEFNSL